jgi:hypothetical protein
MTKKECGAMGGKKTASKYGNEYMANLARKAAQAMHAKYEMVPFDQNDFMLVDRTTGKPNRKTLNGRVLA